MHPKFKEFIEEQLLGEVYFDNTTMDLSANIVENRTSRIRIQEEWKNVYQEETTQEEVADYIAIVLRKGIQLHPKIKENRKLDPYKIPLGTHFKLMSEKDRRTAYYELLKVGSNDFYLIDHDQGKDAPSPGSILQTTTSPFSIGVSIAFTDTKNNISYRTLPIVMIESYKANPTYRTLERKLNQANQTFYAPAPDREKGFLAETLSLIETTNTLYTIKIKGEEATFSLHTQTGQDALKIYFKKAELLLPACQPKAEPNGYFSNISTLVAGKLKRKEQYWKVISKAVIEYEDK